MDDHEPQNASTAPDHIPVLPDAVVCLVLGQPFALSRSHPAAAFTSPASGAPARARTIVDGTFGAGGHARLIAAALPAGSVYVGVDRDPSAVDRFAAFAAEFPQLTTRFERSAFPDAFARLHADRVSADAVILDVGVSSMQLDQPERGFAYSYDAPLDMRMDTSAGRTAADVLNQSTEAELTTMLRDFGEERYARRIAAEIVTRRTLDPFVTTAQLVYAIERALPAKVRFAPGGHPARRTFQALRIAVNDELGMLDQGLDAALELLALGGTLVAISFHSLEDRIVKRRFESWAKDCVCPPGLPMCVCDKRAEVELLTKRPVVADAHELASNSRAASAKLRAARKLPLPELAA